MQTTQNILFQLNLIKYGNAVGPPHITLYKTKGTEWSTYFFLQAMQTQTSVWIHCFLLKSTVYLVGILYLQQLCLSDVTRLWYISSSVNSFYSSNAHAQTSSWARSLDFGRTLRLLLYFMCANSDGSGETMLMRRLTWAFAGRFCDTYHNLMSWLVYTLLPIICLRSLGIVVWNCIRLFPYPWLQSFGIIIDRSKADLLLQPQFYFICSSNTHVLSISLKVLFLYIPFTDSESHHDDSDSSYTDSESHQTDSESHQMDSECHQTDSECHQTDSESHHDDSESHQTDSESHQTDSESHQTDSESSHTVLTLIRLNTFCVRKCNLF